MGNDIDELESDKETLGENDDVTQKYYRQSLAITSFFRKIKACNVDGIAEKD